LSAYLKKTMRVSSDFKKSISTISFAIVFFLIIVQTLTV
jgi:hypothetical protein